MIEAAFLGLLGVCVAACEQLAESHARCTRIAQMIVAGQTVNWRVTDAALVAYQEQLETELGRLERCRELLAQYRTLFQVH